MHPHTIVVGLGFGDEAKGATIAHLAATTDPAAVVRFNGGAQTAHNVVDGDRHHTFRLFGSGTFAGTPTHLSRHVIVDPWMLAAEAEELAALGVRDPLGFVTVSPDALVATPIHVAVNRTREDLRGGAAHGSCGLGIGETRWYSLAYDAGLRAGRTLWGVTADVGADAPPLTVADCADAATVRARLAAFVAFYAPLLARGAHPVPPVDVMVETLVAFGAAVAAVRDVEYLAGAARSGHLLFEGAQGVLLDEWAGFHPHTTWSTTLPGAAQELLAGAGLAPATVVGVLRTYTSRHGHGPMPTEDPGLLDPLPEPHNGTGRYQGAWRVGHVDEELVRYAAAVCREHGGLDALAVSHLDTAERAGGAIRRAAGYAGRPGPYPLGRYRDLRHQERLTATARAAVPLLRPIRPADVAEHLAAVAGVRLHSVATGPDIGDRCLVDAGAEAAA